MKKKGLGCSPGIAFGKAYKIGLNDDLDNIPNNSIIIVEKSSPQ